MCSLSLLIYLSNLLEQNRLIPYLIGFDNNKVFKEQLAIITSVQVCRIISLGTNEMLEESESKDWILALKITSEYFSSDGDPNSKEVSSEESQPLVT